VGAQHHGPSTRGPRKWHGAHGLLSSVRFREPCLDSFGREPTRRRAGSTRSRASRTGLHGLFPRVLGLGLLCFRCAAPSMRVAQGTRGPCFLRVEFMRVAGLVGGSASFGGNRALLRGIHRGKAPGAFLGRRRRRRHGVLQKEVSSRNPPIRKLCALRKRLARMRCSPREASARAQRGAGFT